MPNKTSRKPKYFIGTHLHDAERYSTSNKFGYYKRKNKIETPNCSVCGEPNAFAHHPDYEQPFSVIWLCRGCHAKEHSRLLKEVKKCYM